MDEIKKIRFLFKKVLNRKLPNRGLISENCKIQFPSKANIEINNHIILQENCMIKVIDGATLKIGKNFGMNRNGTLVARSNITIGDNVIIGPNCCIYDHDHNYNRANLRTEFINGEITIGDNVWIGANCTILRGTIIGNNSIIGANSCLKGIVEPNSIYYEKNEKIIKPRKTIK